MLITVPLFRASRTRQSSVEGPERDELGLIYRYHVPLSAWENRSQIAISPRLSTLFHRTLSAGLNGHRQEGNTHRVLDSSNILRDIVRTLHLFLLLAVDESATFPYHCVPCVAPLDVSPLVGGVSSLSSSIIPSKLATHWIRHRGPACDCFSLLQEAGSCDSIVDVRDIEHEVACGTRPRPLLVGIEHDLVQLQSLASHSMQALCPRCKHFCTRSMRGFAGACRTMLCSIARRKGPCEGVASFKVAVAHTRVVVAQSLFCMFPLRPGRAFHFEICPSRCKAKIKFTDIFRPRKSYLECKSRLRTGSDSVDPALGGYRRPMASAATVSLDVERPDRCRDCEDGGHGTRDKCSV